MKKLIILIVLLLAVGCTDSKNAERVLKQRKECKVLINKEDCDNMTATHKTRFKGRIMMEQKKDFMKVVSGQKLWYDSKQEWLTVIGIINIAPECPILCKDINGYQISFTKDGRETKDGPQVLFWHESKTEFIPDPVQEENGNCQVCRYHNIVDGYDRDHCGYHDCKLVNLFGCDEFVHIVKKKTITETVYVNYYPDCPSARDRYFLHDDETGAMYKSSSNCKHVARKATITFEIEE